MSQIEKLIAKIHDPKRERNVTFTEMKKVLEAHGWKHDRTKGSHHHFISPTGRLLPIPLHDNPLKPAYVRQARRLLSSVD